MPRRLPLALCVLALACGGGGSTGNGDPVETVTVTPAAFELTIGGTRQLTATLRDAEGNELSGREVEWTSLSTAIATVSSGGLVTGVAAGTANIQAASEGKTGTSAATVTAEPVPPDPPEESSVFIGFYDKTNNSNFGDWFASPPIYVQYDLSLQPAHPGKATGVWSTGGWLQSAGSEPSSRRVTTRSILITGGYASPSSNNASRVAISLDVTTYQGTELQMAVPRIYHTSTLLLGQKVLIAGGFDNAAVTNTAEVFDEATKTFSPTGAMGEARGRHAAAPLPDGGRVLITGGLVPQGGGPATIDVASTEVYDPTAGEFEPGPDMTVTRFNHSSIALDDGRVLVLGGNGRNSAEVYDPVANEFTAVDDMELIHGLGHQAVKLLDGRVLVVGGGAVNPVQPTAGAEIFDPETDQWSRIDDMTTPRMLHFAVTRADGSVLIGGGQDDTGELLASTELFDPVSETFTASTPLNAEATEAFAVYIDREE